MPYPSADAMYPPSASSSWTSKIISLIAALPFGRMINFTGGAVKVLLVLPQCTAASSASSARGQVVSIHGVPCGRWCPKGRKAEDGPIDPKYPLKKTPSASYIQRTPWNVRDSDATVLFSINATSE